MTEPYASHDASKIEPPSITLKNLWETANRKYLHLLEARRTSGKHDNLSKLTDALPLCFVELVFLCAREVTCCEIYVQLLGKEQI